MYITRLKEVSTMKVLGADARTGREVVDVDRFRLLPLGGEQLVLGEDEAQPAFELVDRTRRIRPNTVGRSVLLIGDPRDLFIALCHLEQTFCYEMYEAMQRRGSLSGEEAIDVATRCGAAQVFADRMRAASDSLGQFYFSRAVANAWQELCTYHAAP